MGPEIYIVQLAKHGRIENHYYFYFSQYLCALKCSHEKGTDGTTDITQLAKSGSIYNYNFYIFANIYVLLNVLMEFVPIIRRILYNQLDKL